MSLRTWRPWRARTGGRIRPRQLVGGLVAAVAVASFASCTVPTPRLGMSTILSNLSNPWDLAFTPNNGGELFFTERSGNIDYLNGTTKVVLAHPADVLVNGEAGMMGLAIDPGFYTNGRIYTCFASTLGSSGFGDVRVVRWTVNAQRTALANRTDILPGISFGLGRHSGCRIRFGPDHMLWVTTGDTATNTVPQDPNALGGKVLRITTDGAPASGNAGAPFRPEIYTYGHRNPQGLAFRADGTAFEVEHGTDCDDEINVLVRGGNYGWDPKPPGGGSLYDESQPMTDLVKFPNAQRAKWSSGCPTIAPSGATFVEGAEWGSWNGTLAVAVLKDQRLQVFAFGDTASGNALGAIGSAITDQGRLRVVVEAPDHSLWIATDSATGKILRYAPA